MTVAYGNVFSARSMICFRPCCAVVDVPSNVYGGFGGEIPSFSYWPVVVHNCFDGLDIVDLPAFQLCETRTPGTIDRKTKDRALPLRPLNATVSENHTTMTTCSAGHKAHCFLAVDAHSACWDDDNFVRVEEALSPATSSFCWHAMAKIPVHFLCFGQKDPLPYTLVCDHRQDCLDNSDEEFCVFPPCTGDTPLRCASNQQVAYQAFLQQNVCWLVA